MRIVLDLNERDGDRLKLAAERMGFRALNEFALGCVQARLRQIEHVMEIRGSLKPAAARDTEGQS